MASEQTEETRGPAKISGGHLVRVDKIAELPSRQREYYGDLESLAMSIARVGQLVPIIVQKDNTLVAGARRLRAVKMLGQPSIRAIYVDEADPVLLKEIELEENLRRKNLEWPEEVKALKELNELKRDLYGGAIKGYGGGWGLKETAEFTGTSIGKTSQDIQLAEAIETHPKLAKEKNKAQAWKAFKRLEEKAIQEELAKRVRVEIKEGEQVIFNEKAEVWLPTLEDESADLVFTDPPYGKRFELKNNSMETYEDDPLDVMKLIEICANEWFRILKPDRACLVWFDMYHYQTVKDSMTNAGFHVSDFPFIWCKNVPGPLPYDSLYAQGYETLLHCQKGSRSLNFPGQTNWHQWSIVQGTKKVHPTQKPLDMLQYFVEQHTLPGELVIDSFAGSGTTIAASILSDRRAMGCEMSKDFYNSAVIYIGDCITDKAKKIRTEETQKITILPSDFRELSPGTPEWLEYWQRNPDKQEEMMAYSKELREAENAEQVEI